MMVFSPEFSWRVLGLLPWWCWLLIVASLLGVVGVAELLHGRAVRREAAASSVAVEARAAGADDWVVSGS